MKLMTNTSTSSTLMTKEADLLSPPPRGSIRRSSVATGDMSDTGENSAKEPNIRWIPDVGGGLISLSSQHLLSLHYWHIFSKWAAHIQTVFNHLFWYNWPLSRDLCCQDCTGHGEMFHLRRLGKSDWCRLRTSCWLSSSSAVLLYCPLLLSSPVLYCCLSSSSAPEAAFPHFIFRLHSHLGQWV